MRWTEVLQQIGKMRFEEAYAGWDLGRLTQAEAASLLGVCERTFRRYLARYEALGLEGLMDRRLERVSHKKAPVDEVMRLTDTYRQRHSGWRVKHFYAWYCKDDGAKSYTWVKNRLQEAGLVPKAKARGAHRKRRERSPLPGLMIHQDGCTHEWVRAFRAAVWYAPGALAPRTGASGHHRHGGGQSLSGADLPTCLQRRIHAARHGKRQRIRRLDWRAVE